MASPSNIKQTKYLVYGLSSALTFASFLQGGLAVVVMFLMASLFVMFLLGLAVVVFYSAEPDKKRIFSPGFLAHFIGWIRDWLRTHLGEPPQFHVRLFMFYCLWIGLLEASSGYIYQYSIPAAIILLILVRYEQSPSPTPRYWFWSTLKALTLAAIIFIGRIEIIQVIRSLDTGEIEVLNSIAPSIVGTLSIAILSLLVVSQFPPIGIGVKIFITGTILGSLLSLSLTYPVFTWVFDHYVPGVFTAGDKHQQIVLICLVISLVISLLSGIVIARWAQPNTLLQKLFVGGLTGAIVGGCVFGFIGGPASGIIAQALLFPITLTREGFGGDTWTYRIAIAVNNVMPGTFVASWFLIGGGALFGLLCVLLLPSPKDLHRPSSIPGWQYFLYELAGPGLLIFEILDFAVISSVYVLLQEKILNTFTQMGISPSPNPNLMLEIFLSQHRVLILVMLSVCVAWIHLRLIPYTQMGGDAHVIRSQKALYTIFLILGVSLAWGTYIIQASPLSYIFGLITLAVTLEGWLAIAKFNALNAPEKRDQLLDPDSSALFQAQSHWQGAALPLGFFISILGMQLLFSAISLALIAIVLIAPIRDATTQLPSLQWLMENSLQPLINVSASIFPMFLFAGIMFSISAKDPFVFPVQSLKESNRPTSPWWKYWQQLLEMAHKGQQLISWERYKTPIWVALLLTGVILGGFFDSIFAFIASILVFSFALRAILSEDLILHLGIKAILGLFLVIFCVLLTPLLPFYNVWVSSVRNLLSLSAIILILRIVQLYVPDNRKILFRQLFLIGLSIAFITLISVDKHPVQPIGGVSSFDNQSWAVFAQAEDLAISPIGENVNYRIFQDTQKRLWFANGIGMVVGRQADEWNLYFLNTTQVSQSSDLDVEEQKSFFFEDEQNRVWLASGSQFVLFEPDRQIHYPLDTATEATDTTFYSVPVNLAGNPFNLKGYIRDAAQAPNGDIWLISDDHNAIQFIPGKAGTKPTWTTHEFQETLLSVYPDRSGKIWFGTTRGPRVLDDQGVAPLKLPESVDVFEAIHFFEDRSDTLWIGTNQGMYRYQSEPASLQPEDSWPGQIVPVVFYETAQGVLWIGTNAGLYQYQEPNWIEVLPDISVTVITEGLNNSLWIGANQGLWKYIPASSSSIRFDITNSGLADNWVRDILIDDQGVLWVSTYNQVMKPGWLPWVVSLTGIFFLLLFVAVRNSYEQSLATRARRLGNHILQDPTQLLSRLFDTIARTPNVAPLLRYVGFYLDSAQHHSGAKISRAIANLLDGQSDDLHPVIAALQEDTHHPDTQSLAAYYQVISCILSVGSIKQISQLDLNLASGAEGTTLRIFAPQKVEVTLPTWINPNGHKAWQTFASVTQVLKKYASVEGAIDQLGYLTQAIDVLDTTGQLSVESSPPDNSLLLQVSENWRNLIRSEIALISGRAELKLDLLTRQIRNTAQGIVALRVQNIGQAMAERIRIKFYANMSLSTDGTPITLDRLSAGQSETVELNLIDSSSAHIPIVGEILWDDQLSQDHVSQFEDFVKRLEVHEKFERIPNPFIVGHPVKSTELFQGRSDIFEFILQNISNATQQSRTLVLYGQRRTGKTSILYQLLGGRLGPDYIPVLIDVQELTLSIGTTADFFLEIGYAIERSLHQNNLKSKLPDAIEFYQTPTRALSRYLNEIEVQLKGRKIVVMFDEFELIEDRISKGKLEPEALGYLRSLMQHKDFLAFIFTGTHKLEQMSADYWSVFFNIALHQQVSFMKPDEATHLIQKPLLGKLSIDDLVVAKILALTHGHPYFVQLLCWALVNHCNKNERNYAALNDLNEILKDLIATGDAYFAYIWQPANFVEKLVLAALAESLTLGKKFVTVQEVIEVLAQSGARDLTKLEVVQALDGLINQEIIMTGGSDKLQYTFRVGLIGEWVRSSKPTRYLVERKS